MTSTTTTATTDTTAADRYAAARAYMIGETIRAQVDRGVFMSLGAHGFLCGMLGLDSDNGATMAPGLAFSARVLPYRADGRRASSPRIMRVTVTLTAADLYRVEVAQRARGDRWGLEPRTMHYAADGVDAASLSRVLLAVDSDDDRPDAR